MDNLSKVERSQLMSRVGQKNTEPEMTVRSLLHALGFRFRIHRKDLAGCPDIVLRKYNLCIFVHGCFWHGHSGCQRSKLPSSNTEFWVSKIKINQERDVRSLNTLKAQGWRVGIIWECQTKKPELLLDAIYQHLPAGK